MQYVTQIFKIHQTHRNSKCIRHTQIQSASETRKFISASDTHKFISASDAHKFISASDTHKFISASDTHKLISDWNENPVHKRILKRLVKGY